MPSSVGQAFAILRDRKPGNKEEAKGFLESMSLGQLKARNNQEIRQRGPARKKFQMGSRYGL